MLLGSVITTKPPAGIGFVFLNLKVYVVVTPEILDPSRMASELLVVVISPSKVLSESPVNDVQAATPYPFDAVIEIATV